MDAALERIVALAWRSVSALEANEAMLRARRATAAGEEALRKGTLGADETSAAEDDLDAPLARSYEIALAASATFESFAREQLPKLVYHLESIGAHLPHAGGVVICLFAGERLHFLQAGELIAAVCRELGKSADELVALYGTGELRTAVRAPSAPASAAAPLALPPPEKKR